MATPTRSPKELLVPTALGLLAALFLAVMSVLFAGAGHGTYVPMIVCFPYGMVLAVLHNSIEVPHIVLGIAQFPIYGAVVGISRRRAKPWRIWLVLGALHVAAVAFALFAAMKGHNFLP